MFQFANKRKKKQMARSFVAFLYIRYIYLRIVCFSLAFVLSSHSVTGVFLAH